MLTPATQAQLTLSRKMAKQLVNPTLADIEAVIKQCLERDANWIKVSKKALIGIKADDELRLDPSKLAVRAAFDYARSNQHPEALASLDTAIDLADDPQVKAWLLSRKAAFQHALDSHAAQRTLAAAHAIEPQVTKPMIGATYKPLSPTTGQQAATLISNHHRRFMDATAMKLYADGLCSDLQFRPDTSDKFEAAVNDLAWFLGLNSQRPEKEYKEGPDNLWALPNGSFLVIECKNGVTSADGISKKDAGQLSQSMEWFSKRYMASAATPVIVHPERKLGQGASGVSGMRIVTRSGLEKLRANLQALAKQLTQPDTASSVSAVATRLAQFELSADAFVNAYSTTLKT